MSTDEDVEKVIEEALTIVADSDAYGARAKHPTTIHTRKTIESLISALTTSTEENKKLRAEIRRLEAIELLYNCGARFNAARFRERMAAVLRGYKGRATASQSQAEAMKAELDLLRDECRAKSETISAMQGRIDWAYTLRDAAVASHEGQKRNTEAFMQERDEERAQAEAMKAALEEKDAEIERLQTSYRAGIWEEAAAFCAAARDGIDFASLTESTSRQEGGFDMADHLTASFKELAESARRRSTLSIKGGESND